jgi:hypothetical protein
MHNKLHNKRLEPSYWRNFDQFETSRRGCQLSCAGLPGAQAPWQTEREWERSHDMGGEVPEGRLRQLLATFPKEGL